MAEQSAISWTDGTFNPWIGCTRVSPGCDHCYAARDNERRKWVSAWGAERRRTKTWGDPVKWNRKAALTGYKPRIFCASLADVFDNEVPDEWRTDLWKLFDDTPNLRWIVLTKRIGNVAKMAPARWWPHVGIMATMVNQPEYDRDRLKLSAVPAPWRGISAEPLLGRIILDHKDAKANLGDYAGLDRVAATLYCRPGQAALLVSLVVLIAIIPIGQSLAASKEGKTVVRIARSAESVVVGDGTKYIEPTMLPIPHGGDFTDGERAVHRNIFSAKFGLSRWVEDGAWGLFQWPLFDGKSWGQRVGIWINTGSHSDVIRWGLAGISDIDRRPWSQADHKISDRHGGSIDIRPQLTLLGISLNAEGSDSDNDQYQCQNCQSPVWIGEEPRRILKILLGFGAALVPAGFGFFAIGWGSDRRGHFGARLLLASFAVLLCGSISARLIMWGLGWL